jgi:hypothetical protein
MEPRHGRASNLHYQTVERGGDERLRFLALKRLDAKLIGMQMNRAPASVRIRAGRLKILLRRSNPQNNGLKDKNQMIKLKRTAAEQVEDEAERRLLHPLTSRQKISDSQAEPEFEQNHKRLRADRLAREARL